MGCYDDEISFEIDGLDIDGGLDMYEGETEDYLDALRSFVKNVPAALDKLRGLTEENLTEYAVSVHGLKAMSAWICASEINSEAAELESLARANAFEGLIERNEALIGMVDDLVGELGKVL